MGGLFLAFTFELSALFARRSLGVGGSLELHLTPSQALLEPLRFYNDQKPSILPLPE